MTAPAGQPLAIVAGGGALPRHLADAAVRAGRTVIVLGLDGEADADFGSIETHRVRYGEIGRLLDLLSERSCRDVVLAGSVSRPSLKAIRPDWRAMQLMPRLVRIMIGGDDGVLRGIADLFSEQGIALVSPLDIAPDLRAPAGGIVGREPGDAHHREIAVGLTTARTLGTVDAGQAVIVDEGRAIALEGIEGTDAMIRRAGQLRENGRWRRAAPSGVLIKTAKPQQDMRLDVPTVGPETVRLAVDAGLAGIAVEAGRVLVVDREAMAAMGPSKFFVWGAA